MKYEMNFRTGLKAALIVGIVLVVINLFINVDFWSLFPSVSFFLGLGMIVNEGLPVVVDKINNISFQGGNFDMVASYLAMMLLGCLLCIISCFVKEKT